MQHSNNGMTLNLFQDAEHDDCAMTSDHVLAAYLLAHGRRMVAWRVDDDARGRLRAWFVFDGLEQCEQHKRELVNGTGDSVSASQFIRHVRMVRDLAYSLMNGGNDNDSRGYSGRAVLSSAR